MEELRLLEIKLSFISSLIWPATIIAVALLFRGQIRDLIQRLRSGELAGAKFDFHEAASGYIDSKLDELAQETDPMDRQEIAGEIKGVSAILGSIHPISLAIMIDAAEGTHAWIGSSYTGKKEYFDALEQKGLAVVHQDPHRDGDAEAYSISFTQTGRKLLESIGMSPR